MHWRHSSIYKSELSLSFGSMCQHTSMKSIKFVCNNAGFTSYCLLDCRITFIVRANLTEVFLTDYAPRLKWLRKCSNDYYSLLHTIYDATHASHCRWIFFWLTAIDRPTKQAKRINLKNRHPWKTPNETENKVLQLKWLESRQRNTSNVITLRLHKLETH